MNRDDLADENNELSGSARALMVFSIGALSAAAISILVTRLSRLPPPGEGEPETAALTLPGGEAVTTVTAAAISAPDGQPASVTPAVPPAALKPATAGKAVKPSGLSTPAAAPAGSNRWSTPTRYIMGVLLFIAALVVLFIGRATIPMVVAAMLLAVVLEPVIEFFQRRLKKGLAVGLAYFLVVLVLLAIPLLAIPPLIDAVNFVTDIDFQLLAQWVSEQLQNFLGTLQAYPMVAGILQPTIESLLVVLNNFISNTQTDAPALNITFEQITRNFGLALGTAGKVLGPTFSIIAAIFITLLISLQMTLYSDEMKGWYADLIPPGYGPELTALINSIRDSWTGFLRGQIFLMVVIGTVTWLGGSILGLPQALLLGVIAGLMELIPSVGPVLAAVPAVLLALLFGSTHFELNHLIFALIVIAFYSLVQMLENQVLVPRIMGDAVDLPPLVVLIGTIAGAGAFGILGALLATPVIATGNLVFRYVYGKIIEAPPPPPPPEEKPGIWVKVKGIVKRFGKKR